MTRFQFVADHQARYGVKRLCQILKVARSSYYYWRSTEVARGARDAADMVLVGQIRTVHTAHDGTYGAPRITAELQDNGVAVNHKRVARVMRRFGVQGLRLRRRVTTTVADPAAAKAPDLIGRDFTAPAVNQRYVGDIRAEAVGGGPGAAAAQYTSRAFAAACATAGIRQSMSAVGSSADDALAESFKATFKRETLQGRRAFTDERQARLDSFRWLHRYNTVSRHSRLGHQSPITYENTRATPSTVTAAA